MNQTIRTRIPVRKKTDTSKIIAAGDAVDLVLTDKSVATVTLTAVSDGGRILTWNSATVLDNQVAIVDGNHAASAATNLNLHDETSDSQQRTSAAPKSDGIP